MQTAERKGIRKDRICVKLFMFNIILSLHFKPYNTSKTIVKRNLYYYNLVIFELKESCKLAKNKYSDKQ